VFLLCGYRPAIRRDPGRDNETTEKDLIEVMKLSARARPPSRACQFFTWVGRLLLHGILGVSLIRNVPDANDRASAPSLRSRWRCCTIILAILVRSRSAFIAAWKHGTWIEPVVMGMSGSAFHGTGVRVIGIA